MDLKIIYKTITYRIICIISLIIITWIFTRDVIQVTGIVIVFQTIQTILYWLHEKAWSKYGKKI